jgi:hypothetical protein
MVIKLFSKNIIYINYVNQFKSFKQNDLNIKNERII